MDLAAVQLTEFDLHAASCPSEHPQTIQSAAEQWAYAVSFPLPLIEPDTPFPLLITVDITVQEGVVGALVVESDWTTVLSRLASSVGMGPQRVPVVVERNTTGARLIPEQHVGGAPLCDDRFRNPRSGPRKYSVALTSRLREVIVGSPRRLDLERLRAAVQSSTRIVYD